MNAINRIMRLLSDVFENIVALCFLVIFTMTVILVVLRYLFNSSITWGYELVEYLFIYTTALGAAVALAKGGHIGVTVIVERLPRGVRRIVDAAGYLLVAVFNAAVIFYGIPWIRATGGFESPVMRLPNRLIQLIVPIGSGLAIVFCVCHVFLVMTGGSREVEGGAG
jgi:TRAP-type C4-dicarboxylate transport system permease small subunit